MLDVTHNARIVRTWRSSCLLIPEPEHDSGYTISRNSRLFRFPGTALSLGRRVFFGGLLVLHCGQPAVQFGRVFRRFHGAGLSLLARSLFRPQQVGKLLDPGL